MPMALLMALVMASVPMWSWGTCRQCHVAAQLQQLWRAREQAKDIAIWLASSTDALVDVVPCAQLQDYWRGTAPLVSSQKRLRQLFCWWPDWEIGSRGTALCQPERGPPS